MTDCGDPRPVDQHDPRACRARRRGGELLDALGRRPAPPTGRSAARAAAGLRPAAGRRRRRSPYCRGAASVCWKPTRSSRVKRVDRRRVADRRSSHRDGSRRTAAPEARATPSSSGPSAPGRSRSASACGPGRPRPGRRPGAGRCRPAGRATAPRLALSADMATVLRSAVPLGADLGAEPLLLFGDLLRGHARRRLRRAGSSVKFCRPRAVGRVGREAGVERQRQLRRSERRCAARNAAGRRSTE